MAKERESKFTDHYAALIAWYEEEPTRTLEQGVVWLAARGVKAHRGEISRLLAKHQKERRDREDRERMFAGIATGADKCRELDEAFKANPAPHLALIVGLLKNLIINLNLNPETPKEDIERATALLKPVIEFARIEQKQRDAELNLEKFRDATRSKVDAGLDEIAALFHQAPELKAEFEALRSKLNARLAE